MSNVLTISNLSKTFAGQRALDSVSLAVETGEVHALVGQNGSGKSTLIKILAGVYTPDPGSEAELDGQTLSLGSAAAAHAGGLRFVHQDLGLVLALNTLDNLALGRTYPRGRLGGIAWRRQHANARALLASLGYSFDLRIPVGRLTAAERTGIAIVRALDPSHGTPRLVVLDEPTAALPRAEVARLYEAVRALRQQDVAVLYVSHHFNEVFDLSDRVTVLRDGRRVAVERTADLDEDTLISLTIGGRLEAPTRADGPRARPDAKVAALECEEVSGSGVEELSFQAEPGEIVAFAGVTGSGRESVAGLLFGATRRSGVVKVGGKIVPPSSPRASVRDGLALVPAQRFDEALLHGLGVKENLTIAGLRDFFQPHGIDARRELDETYEWFDRFGIVPRKVSARIETLSGGNQQKVVMARALRLRLKTLILDGPTQGVDVGAKAAIHRIIREAADGGLAVILVSTESEEIAQLADRVLVMANGRVERELIGGEFTADELTEATLTARAATTN